MAHKFAEIAFTESVREVQQQMGSRAGYTSFEEGDDYNHRLSERETSFIGARDSFYMASVSETGWPYVQHRGGPAGFVRVIDAQTIGFTDFRGNRQYVSVGNLRKDDRVSLFFMDYANRTRLKLLGRVRLIGDEEPELLAQLESADYDARVERGFVIHVEAFDWNCPQHITPRYTETEVRSIIAPIQQELKELKAGGIGRREKQALGEGPLPLVISGVRQLTPGIRAFELRNPDGGELPAVEVGSHLQIPLRLDDGTMDTRSYSICSNPQRRDIYEIAVLRETDGTGGSVAVHEQFDIGLRLDCELPLNNFALHGDERPAILIAGGIGITPIKPMAQALKLRGNTFQMHYAAASAKDMAFRDRLQREFSHDLKVYFSSAGERMDLRQILSEAPDDVIFYLCGPGRLIDGVVETAKGLDMDLDRIRFERFLPATIVDARPIQLELRRSGKQIEVPADQSVLDAILEAGIDAAFSCRVGNCRTCAVKVLEGEAEHRDAALSVHEREQEQMMCVCVSRACGEHLVLDI